MKDMFRRKGFMIIGVFTICGVFINMLCVTTKYQLSFSYNASLSSFDKISVTEDRETPINEKVFLQFLLNDNQTEAIIKEGENSTIYIFDMSHKFTQIQMLSGRYFAKEDFQSGAPVALVSVDRASDVEIVDSIQTIKIAGERYRVIGTFNNPDYPGKVYVNLIALLQRSYGFPINGDYLISKVETSKVSAWKAFVSDKKGFLQVVERSAMTALQDMVRDYAYLRIVFALCVFAIALSAINGIYYWLLQRKEEIGIRLLVGATHRDIVRMIVLNFSQKLFLSFAVSLLVTSMIFQAIAIHGLNLTVGTSFLAAAFLYLLGLLILVVGSYGFITKEVSIQIGGE